MKTTITTLTALSILLTASTTEAQDRWSFELRANGAVPTRNIDSEELDYSGFGFEGTLSYRFLPHLAAYGGWDWMHFNPEGSFAGVDADFEETGYVFGLRFEHPLMSEDGSGLAGWFRAGGTWDHVEIEDGDGTLVADSGHGLGWEVGAGLSMGLGTNWRFTPGVRYRALSRDVEIGNATTTMDLNYLALEIGVARRF